MRGRAGRTSVARFGVLVMILAASSCRESADDRSREMASRVREHASTRESETVQRASTPGDPHRILYHAPTDLSETSARATNAAIVGIRQAPEPAQRPADSSASRVKPPR